MWEIILSWVELHPRITGIGIFAILYITIIVIYANLKQPCYIGTGKGCFEIIATPFVLSFVLVWFIVWFLPGTYLKPIFRFVRNK